MERSPTRDVTGSTPVHAAPTGAVPPDLAEAVERHGDGLADYCRLWVGDAPAAVVAETVRAALLLTLARRDSSPGRGETRDGGRARWYAVARACCLIRLTRPAEGAAAAAGAPPRNRESDAAEPILAGLQALDRRQRETLELAYRHGMDRAEIAAVTGLARERVDRLLTDAQDVYEAWVNVVMLARASRAKCAEGAELATDWAARPGRSARTRLRMHVTECATCSAPAGLTVDAAALLSRIPFTPLTEEQRAHILDTSLPAPAPIPWGADGFPVQPDRERPAAAPALHAPVLSAGLEANRTADFWDPNPPDVPIDDPAPPVRRHTPPPPDFGGPRSDDARNGSARPGDRRPASVHRDGGSPWAGRLGGDGRLPEDVHDHGAAASSGDAMDRSIVPGDRRPASPSVRRDGDDTWAGRLDQDGRLPEDLDGSDNGSPSGASARRENDGLRAGRPGRDGRPPEESDGRDDIPQPDGGREGFGRAGDRRPASMRRDGDSPWAGRLDQDGGLPEEHGHASSSGDGREGFGHAGGRQPSSASVRRGNDEPWSGRLGRDGGLPEEHGNALPSGDGREGFGRAGGRRSARQGDGEPWSGRFGRGGRQPEDLGGFEELGDRSASRDDDDPYSRVGTFQVGRPGAARSFDDDFGSGPDGFGLDEYQGGRRRRSGRALAATAGVVLVGGLAWVAFSPSERPINLKANEAPASATPEVPPTPVPAPPAASPTGVAPTGSAYGKNPVDPAGTAAPGADAKTTPKATPTGAGGGASAAPGAGAGSGGSDSGGAGGGATAGTTRPPAATRAPDFGVEGFGARPDGNPSATPGGAGNGNPGAAPTVAPEARPSGGAKASPSPLPTGGPARPTASPSPRGGRAGAAPARLIAAKGNGGDRRSEIILLRAVNGTVAWRAAVSTPLLQLSSTKGVIGPNRRDGFRIRLTPLDVLARQGNRTVNHLLANCGRTRTAVLRIAWEGVNQAGARTRDVIPVRITFNRPCP